MSRTVTVKGIGSVSAKPDYVVLSLSLRAADKEYNKAMEKAALQIEQLNDSLVVAGFEREFVKTSNFHVQTDYNSVRDDYGNYNRVFQGYVCSHQLKVEFDLNPERLSKALSVIGNCLAKPELSISFTVKDSSKINKELLKAAAANAKEKAKILCEASGVGLGSLLSIDYNWEEWDIYSKTQYSISEDCLCQAAGQSRSIDIQPEDIKVRDTAVFLWEMVEN